MEQQERFDLVITYEDFLHRPSQILTALHGLAAPPYYDFKRTKRDILEFNRSHSAWCRKYYRRRWDFGNIHFQRDGTVQLLPETRGVERPRGLSRVYHRFRGLLSDGR